jgi:acyl-CoA thioesterase
VPQTDDQPPFDFDTATAVRRGEGDVFLADLDPTWQVGGGILNGGYLLSVAAQAAVQDSPHPHPVAMSASYVRTTAADTVQLQVTPGATGRTLAHSLVTLSDAAGRPSLTVQATTATLGSEEPEYADAPMPVMPPPEECVDMAARLNPDPSKRPGLSRHVDSRLDPATAGWTVGEPSDEPVIRAWVRFVDGRPADPLALLTFADVLPPLGFVIGHRGWAPTVQLQVLVRGLPAPGWCLAETSARQIAGGWLDEDCSIWDSTGRLVAQARQLARMSRAGG